jgi:hypothetical protein
MVGDFGKPHSMSSRTTCSPFCSTTTGARLFGYMSSIGSFCSRWRTFHSVQVVPRTGMQLERPHLLGGHLVGGRGCTCRQPWPAPGWYQ